MIYLKQTFKSFIFAAVAASALSVAAQAQIAVHDRFVESSVDAAKDILKEMDSHLEDSNKFENEETKPYYKNALDSYEKQINQLDAALKALGYYESDNGSKGTATSSSTNYFDTVGESSAGRGEIKNLPVSENPDGAYSYSRVNSGGGIGGGLLSGCTGSSYLCGYGFDSAGKLYPQNAVLAKSVTELYSAHYLADTLVGKVDKERRQREEVYDKLLQDVGNAKNLKEAVEAQNAILLENGRNLTLLINLQTAQLNAQSAQLREVSRGKQSKKKSFGDTPVSSAVLSALTQSGLVF